MYSRIVRLGYSYYLLENIYCGIGVNSYTSVFYGLANPYPTRFGNVYGSLYHTSITTEIGYDMIFFNRLIFLPGFLTFIRKVMENPAPHAALYMPSIKPLQDFLPLQCITSSLKRLLLPLRQEG